ncbi:MAG: polyprenyl synthetase family protein [Candidatus Eremiobacteraeota bacterium]|nr:polyprenyl synthetase family protein [Candidatus Eremiobacteraeota bacterium]
MPSPSLAARQKPERVEGTGPEALARHQDDIARYLRSNALPERSLAGAMVAYHMGWIDRTGRSVSSSPGKFIRPSLCVWACEATGGDIENAMPVAAALEWTHNFTLVHDDIQDRDRMRRHRETVWAIWGEAQGINAGDALHALAIRTLTQPGPHPERQIRAARVIAEATLATVEGQCMDLSSEGRPDMSLRAYLRVVGAKTGALLGASLESGAVMAGASDEVVRRFGDAGRLLGKAFQIRDDWLGVWGDSTATGKSTHGDMDRRKLTFPIVAGYARMRPAQRRRMRALFAPGTRDAGARIRALLEEAGGAGATEPAAGHYADRAVARIKGAGIDDARVREFIEVAEYVATRVR